MRRIRFTEHALLRLEERFKLKVESIREFIEKELFVPIGRDGSSNRLSLLIYSILDNEYIVFIYDEKTKEVVTVLPSNYHNRWVVSPAAIIESRNLAILGRKDQEKSPKKQSKGQREQPFCIYASFKAVFSSDTRYLFSWPNRKHKGDINRLLQDAKFIKTLRSTIEKIVEINRYKKINWLIARLGKGKLRRKLRRGEVYYRLDPNNFSICTDPINFSPK